MTETSEKFLGMMLEGYENNLEGVTQYISQPEQQLEDAKASQVEMLAHVEELKSLLGVEDSEEDSEE